MISGSQSPPRRYFYPRPPGGGRHLVHTYAVQIDTISIHALRVEGDVLTDALELVPWISIHALRVEGDLISQS